ncbi:unnamed protein product [Orchesella dallaii]|uniref:Uncharacterized protein n=1 Tax=Orchesella dallaii TaxID=48710 RepID=A0ABP1RE64_9HEXA
MEVLATGDFNSVIKLPNNYFKTDLHLRPVEYLVSRVDKQGNLQVLVLSPFEVNELMPLFRKGKTPLKLHMFTMRIFERQDVLINNDRLQLPLCRPVSVISEESRAMAAMLLASGSLYFNSQSEQEAFARYLGLIPQPWTDQQTLAFESGMITNTGFLRADSAFRKANWEDFMVETFSFTEDPIKLVKKILRGRHPVVNEVAHVIRLLDDAFLVPIDY